ncbi:MAG: transposase InsO family protein [Paracoccaceae bacterium]|jgi:transposase InsO family protein
MAAIIDLYSRRFIGWAVSNRMKRDLAIRALDMAVDLRTSLRNLCANRPRNASITRIVGRNTAQTTIKSA